MLTAVPAGGFTEIGTVDVVPGAYGENATTNLSDFKRNIRPYVCKAGGDAAVAQANGYGIYIKATILTTSPSAAVTASEGTPKPQSGGCQYDMQCKGDRICVSGQCTSPEKNR